MRFSNILLSYETDEYKKVVDCWNLLMVRIYSDSSNMRTFLLEVEAKLGYFWDGEQWIKQD